MQQRPATAISDPTWTLLPKRNPVRSHDPHRPGARQLKASATPVGENAVEVQPGRWRQDWTTSRMKPSASETIRPALFNSCLTRDRKDRNSSDRAGAGPACHHKPDICRGYGPRHDHRSRTLDEFRSFRIERSIDAPHTARRAHLPRPHPLLTDTGYSEGQRHGCQQARATRR